MCEFATSSPYIICFNQLTLFSNINYAPRLHLTAIFYVVCVWVFFICSVFSKRLCMRMQKELFESHTNTERVYTYLSTCGNALYIALERQHICKVLVQTNSRFPPSHHPPNHPIRSHHLKECTMWRIDTHLHVRTYV